MAHPFAESLYAVLFDVDTEEELEQSLEDWSQCSSAERSFAVAQLTWMLGDRLDTLNTVLNTLTQLGEEALTKPDEPPDVLDVEVIDG